MSFSTDYKNATFGSTTISSIFIMATTQQFETVVTLNTQQAKNELAALQKTVEDLKKKKAEALRDNGSTVKDINK